MNMEDATARATATSPTSRTSGSWGRHALLEPEQLPRPLLPRQSARLRHLGLLPAAGRRPLHQGGRHRQEPVFTLTWTTDFAVPPLDTDGDQIDGFRRGWFLASSLRRRRPRGGVRHARRIRGLDGVRQHHRTSGVQRRADRHLLRQRRRANGEQRLQLQRQPRADAPGPHAGLPEHQRPDFLRHRHPARFLGARVASATYTGNGAYQTLTFDMTGQVDWAGTLTDLRLDPVSGVGIQFDIDWIRGPGM